MQVKTYTTTILTADEGHFLHLLELENVENAVISDKVYLASNDSPENWREITEEEANSIKEAQSEASQKSQE